MMTFGLLADADALELLPPPVEHALRTSASTDAPRASMRNLRIGSSFCDRECAVAMPGGRSGSLPVERDAPMSGIWRQLRFGSVPRRRSGVRRGFADGGGPAPNAGRERDALE